MSLVDENGAESAFDVREKLENMLRKQSYKGKAVESV